MFQRILNISQSSRRALSLIGIYALHLVFLQLLMTETPLNKADNSFKPLFTHTSKSPITNPRHHPAVSYYTQLIKQGTFYGRALSEAPTIISHAVEFLIPTISSNTIELSNIRPSNFQLPEAAYKRYRLFQVFLI